VPEFQFTIAEPTTKDELLADLRRLHEASSVFWEACRTEEFFTPVGNGWSRAGNITLLPARSCGLAKMCHCSTASVEQCSFRMQPEMHCNSSNGGPCARFRNGERERGLRQYEDIRIGWSACRCHVADLASATSRALAECWVSQVGPVKSRRREGFAPHQRCRRGAWGGWRRTSGFAARLVSDFDALAKHGSHATLRWKPLGRQRRLDVERQSAFGSANVFGSTLSRTWKSITSDSITFLPLRLVSILVARLMPLKSL